MLPNLLKRTQGISVISLLSVIYLINSCGSQTDSQGNNSILEQITSPTPFVKSKECLEFLNHPPVANLTYQTFLVPENWDDIASSKFIHVTVIRRPPINPASAFAIPVVFFNGGPGSDSHSSISILGKNKNYDDFDLYFIDQRGTGCSESPPVESDPIKTINRSAFYGASSIIKDAEVIRKTYFKDKPWRIFGQSFGGLIVYKYLMLAPEGVDAAFVHGMSLQSNPRAWTENRLLGLKRVQEEYFKKYPEDKKTITVAKSLINAKQCYQSSIKDFEICGPSIIDSLFSLLPFSNAWGATHKTISELDAVISAKMGPMSFGLFSLGFALKTQFLPQIYKQVTPFIAALGNISSGADIVDICQNAMERLEVRGFNLQDWTLMDCRLLVNMNVTWRRDLKNLTKRDDMVLPQLKTAQNKNNIRLNIYSGAFDSAVPEETFREMSRALPNNTSYTSFPNSGHEGYYSEPKIAEDLKSY